MDRIIELGAAATAVKKAKIQAKKAAEREMHQVTIALLENPAGLNAAGIVSETSSDNLASVLARFRAYLKANNIYTLKKRRLKGDNIYYLDPVR